LPREHPASDVYVTGDFDDWKKTIQLENDNGVFKKTVELPKGRHQYKVSFRVLPRLPFCP
jgi:1,4-alpha-glucan branching enzyme